MMLDYTEYKGITKFLSYMERPWDNTGGKFGGSIGENTQTAVKKGISYYELMI
jgi:hypothetical protein